MFSFEQIEYVPRVKGARTDLPDAERPVNDPPLHVVALYAKDWGIYREHLSRAYDFVMVYGWIVGVFIAEDEEKIVLAHEWFPGDDDVRHTSVIPKVCIEKRFDFQA